MMDLLSEAPSGSEELTVNWLSPAPLSPLFPLQGQVLGSFKDFYEHGLPLPCIK